MNMYASGWSCIHNRRQTPDLSRFVHEYVYIGWSRIHIRRQTPDLSRFVHEYVYIG